MPPVALPLDAPTFWVTAEEPAVKGRAASWLGLGGAMLLTVAFIAGLAYWDEQREAGAALDEMADGQATLAGALAVALGGAGSAGTPPGDVELLARVRGVERPKALAVLLHRAGEPALRASNGASVGSTTVLAALERGASSVRIPREEAGAFGLPTRAAVAGIALADPARGRPWDIVTVASAEHERDRAKWARRRLVLSVLTAAGVVMVFGGLAMRNQRKELVLERELAVADLQQRRDERLQRASRAAVMGTLAMGVAHEISTPLGVIAGRAEQMLARLGHDERLAGGAAAILAQTEHIKQIIRGLLGLARGDAPSAERIDPRAVVDDAVGLVEHRFAKAGVRLRREVGPALPALLGDARLLEHAVVNLLLNACDASRPGDEVVVRAAQNSPGDGAGVRIAVEDAGIGISPADVGRAREPFFTTKARGEGTGLGLAIAHEIVASHRGTLELAPRRPAGTAATILLPPADAPAGAADARPGEVKADA
jgi:signal transduction histidine kinase